MGNSSAKIKANNKYTEKIYTPISIKVRKEEAEMIRNTIANTEYSLTGYILQAIKEKMERDGLIAEQKYKVVLEGRVIYSSDLKKSAENRLNYELKMKPDADVSIVED